LQRIIARSGGASVREVYARVTDNSNNTTKRMVEYCG
jgi:hypothetical protein